MNLLGALTRFSVVHCRGVFDHFLLSLYLNLNYKNWRRVFSDIHKKKTGTICVITEFAPYWGTEH